jgi:5,10-methylenetetrahydromethanopterin reductase
MKLGICSLWGRDVAAFREEVRLASRLGYELVTVGDSPADWHDLYVSLTLAALDAPDAKLAPLVTPPFLRYPLATASALCSLDELSGGWVAPGLATGGSTVLAIGRPPATQAEIRGEMAALNALFAREGTEWNGRPIKPLRFPWPIPICYSAFGPKALALAGEQAEGVILFVGERHLNNVAQRIATVCDPATRGGRNADAINIWAVSYASVRPPREEAIEDLDAFVMVNGMALRTPEALAQVSLQFKDKTLELQARSFIAALPGHAAPLDTIRRLAQARSAL